MENKFEILTTRGVVEGRYNANTTVGELRIKYGLKSIVSEQEAIYKDDERISNIGKEVKKVLYEGFGVVGGKE